jgi:hypothetical protein
VGVAVGAGELGMSDQAPADASAALARLQALVAGGQIAEEAPELIRLADLAATRIADLELREKLAESLICALSVIRFAPLFGHDPEPGRKQAAAVLATLEHVSRKCAAVSG